MAFNDFVSATSGAINPSGQTRFQSVQKLRKKYQMVKSPTREMIEKADITIQMVKDTWLGIVLGSDGMATGSDMI